LEKKTKALKQLTFDDNALAMRLFGEAGANIAQIEKGLNVKIDTRGAIVNIKGVKRSIEIAERLLTELYGLIQKGFRLTPPDVGYAIRMFKVDRKIDLSSIFLDTALVSFKKKVIAPKSVAQKQYIDAIRARDIVFGIGPAGTGKTYLAMAMAVAALTAKKVERIILTRPAIEAGEKLGFLPGDLAAKVDPYLRPLYDALHDMLEFDRVETLLERGIIEVAPLAFMRGRTLNDSFIILDEAQNTTVEQMKMFLTRLGFGSKVVITGDITQIDLPNPKSSGLIESNRILRNVEGIEVVEFSEIDVVRHPLVLEVIRAFDLAEKRAAAARKDATGDGAK
jgi:phosphate starvation-inducible PhoH-like protein